MRNYLKLVFNKWNIVTGLLLIAVVTIAYLVDHSLGLATGGSLAMATGVKFNNASLNEGRSWQDRYGISAASAALFRCVEMLGADDNYKVRGDYNSATAFSSAVKAECINFPLGSEIFDIQAGKLWRKTAASGTDTWVSATLT